MLYPESQTCFDDTYSREYVTIMGCYSLKDFFMKKESAVIELRRLNIKLILES